jgi:hypothetical protein
MNRSGDMPRNSSLDPRHRKRTSKRAISKRARKSGQGRRTFPTKEYLKEQAGRLARFAPHRLEDFVGGSLQDVESQITEDVVKGIRRRSEAQLDQLVEELGVDTRHPDKWQRAFYELAAVHHGVGVISWVQPRGPNRRAAKWTEEADLNLQEMVLREMGLGRTLTEALRIVACDQKKWGRLAPPKKDVRSEKSGDELRFQMLKKRWSIVKKTSVLYKRLARAFGVSSDQLVPLAPADEGKI